MFCRQQLADFQTHIRELKMENIDVIAVSVDPPEKSIPFATDLGLSYPVLCNLNCEEAAKKLGAFYDPEKQFLHATGLIIAPDKTVALSCYSSGAIGRLVAADTLPLIRYLKNQG